MLPKKERINKGSEIREILKRKQFHFATPLLYLTVEKSGKAFSRATVICGSKVGGAVDRNRARRRVFAALSSIWHTLSKNVDMVVIVNDAKASAEDYTASLARGIRKHALCL